MTGLGPHSRLKIRRLGSICPRTVNPKNLATPLFFHIAFGNMGELGNRLFDQSKDRVLRVPATNFIYPTSRPLSLSGLLAFVANDRMPARWLCGSVDSVYGRDQCGFFASRKRSQRSTGSRRSAPWNGSTHPGYSGGSTLTSSNCLSSSWVSMSSAAARLS